MLRKPQKPPEGAKMKETADMVIWKKEFEKMKTEDHLNKLKELGLDDDDLDEFKALEKGETTLDAELGVSEEDPVAKPKIAKGKTKKK
jgi:hypothetical protein